METKEIKIVLILVLMEDTLRETKKNKLINSFNES